jgi:hypothetical protein
MGDVYAGNSRKVVYNAGGGGGVGFGMIIAALLSWTQHHDILWAIIHGILGWFYAIYWCFVYGPLS